MFHPHRWRFVPWPLVLEKQVCWLWPAFMKPRHDGLICVDDGDDIFLGGSFVLDYAEHLYLPHSSRVRWAIHLKSAPLVICGDSILTHGEICFVVFSSSEKPDFQFALKIQLWRQNFYNIKIIRYITKSRKSRTLLPPPTFEKIHPTFSAEQWPTNCQPCLAAWSSGTGFAGIAGYAWSLAFGSADICFQVWTVQMVWWGWLFNMSWWDLGDEWRDELLQMKCEKIGIYKEAPMTQQQLQVDVGWNPFIFSFHVQGCQVACQNMCLIERQKGVWVDFCVEILKTSKNSQLHWKWWSLKSLTSKFCLNKNGLPSHRSSSW